MGKLFDVEIHIDDAKEILARQGLGEGGAVQKFFTNELARLADPYVPGDDAMVMKNSASLTTDGDGIIYNTPYAKYHWYGKLMVDPVTKSSYARAGVQKELTDTDMQYKGAPKRGPYWVQRAYIDNKDELLKETENRVKGETT